ncbi:MAG: DUF4340 domain-containing protein [Deltaproteobacteria bacterium]
MNNYLSRFKGTIIAFVVFILLLGSLFLLETEKPADIEAEKVFPGLKPEEIDSIQIVYPESEILLQREENGWSLATGSGRYKADSGVVQNLIEDVTGMEVEKNLSGDNIDLGEYGFVNSEAEFTVTTPDSDYPVIIGNGSPVGTGTYLYDLGDGRILIVKDHYLWAFLDKEPFDFREKKLVDLPHGKVNRAQIKVGDFSIELRKEKDRWVAADIPEPGAVDQKKIYDLITTYSELEAGGFENDNPEGLDAYGLDAPTAEIGLYTDGQASVISFGKRKDEDDYYIKVSSDNSIYSVSKDYFKKLPRNIDQIRD